MAAPTVVGIFDSPSDAERLRDELLEAGVARHRIVVSRLLAEDGVAAEAPGQSYENQQASDEPVVGRYPDPEKKFGEAVRSGACLVAVAARSHVDKEHIAALMRRYGARGTREGRRS
jgi:hypothetical protein